MPRRYVLERGRYVLSEHFRTQSDQRCFRDAKSGIFEDTIAEETRGGILGILVPSRVWGYQRVSPGTLKDNRLSS